MAENKQDYEKLKKFALQQGISLFGVADIKSIRDEFNLNEALKSRFDRAISLGKRLLDGILLDITDSPTPLYFHHYRQVNYFLDRVAFLISNHIQEKGFLAVPIPASQTLDWERQRGHLSHKKVGSLAGLGWIGRNNLLVNPDLGAKFRLVTVLTDMPLEADKPIEFGCGECQKCIEPCPAQAIKEQREDFDHLTCFEKLKEFRNKGLASHYICGVCVKACSGVKGK